VPLAASWIPFAILWVAMPCCSAAAEIDVVISPMRSMVGPITIHGLSGGALHVDDTALMMAKVQPREGNRASPESSGHSSCSSGAARSYRVMFRIIIAIRARQLLQYNDTAAF